MKTLILLAILAVSYGQRPIPCESPKLWEGERIFLEQSKHYSMRSRIYYDEENMRMKTEDFIEEGKEREYLLVLRLFYTKKEYKVNLITRKCNITTIDFPFRPIGVPKEANFLFEAEVGPVQIANEHLTTVTFYGNSTEDHVRYATTVTSPNCVPIGDNYYNDVTGYVESRYFNIHPITNSTAVFVIPSECTSIIY